MLYRKLIVSAGILFPILRSLCVSGQETASQDPTIQSVLQTSVKGEEIVGDSQIVRAYVSSGTNRFAFVIPSGFRLEGGGTSRLTLVGLEDSCYITIRMLAKPPVGGSSSETVFYRELLLARMPGAIVRKEGEDYALNHSGPAFDLEWQTPAGARQYTRSVFIPSLAGVLQFDVSSPAMRQSDARLSLGMILGTLCSNEGGKLTIVPFSDKS